MTDLKPEDRALFDAAHKALTAASRELPALWEQPYKAAEGVVVKPDHLRLLLAEMKNARHDALEKANSAADEIASLQRQVAAQEGRCSPGGGRSEGLPERVTDQCADAGPCPHSQEVPDVAVDAAVAAYQAWDGPEVMGFRPAMKAALEAARKDLERPAYMRGWNDRENEFLGRAAMILPDGGEAVHARPLSAASAEPSSSGAPGGEVREAVARRFYEACGYYRHGGPWPAAAKPEDSGAIRDSFKFADSILALIPTPGEAADAEPVARLVADLKHDAEVNRESAKGIPGRASEAATFLAMATVYDICAKRLSDALAQIPAPPPAAGLPEEAVRLVKGWADEAREEIDAHNEWLVEHPDEPDPGMEDLFFSPKDMLRLEAALGLPAETEEGR